MVESSIKFQPNSDIVQYFSKLSGLGRIDHSTHTLMLNKNPNKVFIVKGKSIHNVRMFNDSTSCYITAISVPTDGQVLMAANNNKNVKLLAQQYQVVSHCSVTTWPWDMCKSTPSAVAVTVGDSVTHAVKFITVKNRKLVTGRKLQLQHRWYSLPPERPVYYF
ncbi:hypothetical protein DPMN_184855 [Dreissena polymorpha]|uniref:Uncharacterized protein n=1 Tax=Dreissena polymorpha TaxID=45954 RepID=A0A9D4DMJ8_DREPO|nr:hypothetical protein DPMN_184855 [Dreissena polymorpha]